MVMQNPLSAGAVPQLRRVGASKLGSGGWCGSELEEGSGLCRSQPKLEQPEWHPQSEWHRVPSSGPDPQVGSFSWPRDQMQEVGVVLACTKLLGWSAEAPTGQIVTQTITPRVGEVHTLLLAPMAKLVQIPSTASQRKCKKHQHHHQLQ